MYDCFRAYPTRPFFDLYVHVSLRSAIRHADRFAAFGCSLSRRSPYTYKSKSFRFRASSTRPFFDLYVHGSLLRAKKACPCSFIHLLLGQADKYHPAVPPGLTLFRAHSAIHRYTSSIKKAAYQHMLNFAYGGPSLRLPYFTNLYFRSPSEVHSAIRFILQSQHLPFSGMKEELLTHSSSTV